MKRCLFLILVAFAFLQDVNGQSGRKCREGCPEIYAPVCVRSARTPPMTVENECSFEILRCKYPGEAYRIIHRGKCPGT